MEQKKKRSIIMTCQEIKPESSHAKVKLVILNFLKRRLSHSKSTFLPGRCKGLQKFSILFWYETCSLLLVVLGNYCRPLLALLFKKVKYLFHFRSFIQTHAFTMATKTWSHLGWCDELRNVIVYGPLYVCFLYLFSKKPTCYMTRRLSSWWSFRHAY